MAYSKQTWTDDVSAVTGARMTHIEQGIYDNSLATDKIKPSGTATTTAEMEEGQITDVIGFKSLKLKGQTSQYTTQGNNLLNIYARHPVGYTETVSGVTFTYNNDGSVSARGTATADINFFLASNGQLGDDIFNGTNYLSGCTGGSSTTFHLQFWADTIGHFQNTTTEVATNKTAGVNWNITIGIKNGVTINKTFYPMMSATSGKTFEKYSGGKVSPNPDFPQDVNNVCGDNVVGISNKNIARLELEGKIRSYANGNQYTTSGFNGYIASVKPNTTYVSSCQDISTQYTEISNLCYFDDNMNFLSGNVYNGRNKTFTTPANCKYVSIAVNQTIVNFQLEQGSATSYIAHQGNNFEINLGSSNAIINKNLIQDETFVQGGAANNTATTRISCRNIKLKANTTYTLSSSLDYNKFKINICTLETIFPHATPYTYDSGWKGESFSFTVGANDVYANIAVRNEPDGTAIVPSDIDGYHFQIEKGDTATAYEPNFTPIELCKIGNYQDYIYKKDGKWFIHKEINKYILNGGNNENWLLNGSGTYYKYQWATALPDKYNVADTPILCNYFQQITVFQGDSKNIIGIVNGHYSDYSLQIISDISTLSDFKTWLSTNTPSLYYVLATPTEEEITYTPLIRQLDELYNSGLYDVTNISQDNSSEAFVLDLEACKNNINGIVEYIRR